jgi:hypothetical protein
LLVGEFDGDVNLPGAVARGVRAAAGVVVGEAGGDVVRDADVVVGFGMGTFQNVNESLVFGHPKAKATAVPTRWHAERAGTMKPRHTDRCFSDLSGGDCLQDPHGLACRVESHPNRRLE